MVTPKEARKIAELLDNAPYASSCTNDAADALRDLASQVESLQADAERLDWLDKLLSDGEPKRIACLPGALRKVIDAEREREQS